MNVRFTGRHVGISDSDREWAAAKAEALSRFHRIPGQVEVRVEKDGGILERVEIEAGLGRQHRAVARAEASTFRAAFDLAAEGLKRQMKKDKERVVDRRRRAPSPLRKPGETER
ncbi:MAG: ribosome-associated translation inhibitor RaiA [Planctomycetaceae bacterium]|nr:ribosome-associated translation inhibitor RaiA [Planctomycetota bacterium]NUN51907.1 ribosome-associated translation inhibitor RaiA [Planctomycetaceae bacterium]